MDIKLLANLAEDDGDIAVGVTPVLGHLSTHVARQVNVAHKPCPIRRQPC